MIGADDSLDVFGVHALGGIFGALMTGIFNAPVARRSGPRDRLGDGHDRLSRHRWRSSSSRRKPSVSCSCWTAVVAFISFQIVKLTVGLRVSEEDEREGLDITSHGERAYTA